MKQCVTHRLSKEDALSIATDALKSYVKRYVEYQPKIQWLNRYEAEISFKFKGIKLKGSIEIDDEKIWLDMDIPFLLLPFKHQALNVIHSEITSCLKLAQTVST
jgi:hypothetical protein